MSKSSLAALILMWEIGNNPIVPNQGTKGLFKTPDLRCKRAKAVGKFSLVSFSSDVNILRPLLPTDSKYEVHQI